MTAAAVVVAVVAAAAAAAAAAGAHVHVSFRIAHKMHCAEESEEANLGKERKNQLAITEREKSPYSFPGDFRSCGIRTNSFGDICPRTSYLRSKSILLRLVTFSSLDSIRYAGDIGQGDVQHLTAQLQGQRGLGEEGGGSEGVQQPEVTVEVFGRDV